MMRNMLPAFMLAFSLTGCDAMQEAVQETLAA